MLCFVSYEFYKESDWSYKQISSNLCFMDHGAKVALMLNIREKKGNKLERLFRNFFVKRTYHS